MSRKHNTKHPGRSRSNYPARLRARGVTSASVRMPSLSELRTRAGRRAWIPEEIVEATRPLIPQEDE